MTEPAPEMIAAAEALYEPKYHQDGTPIYRTPTPIEIYNAMVAAAPKNAVE